jgi:hypothetical protein
MLGECACRALRLSEAFAQHARCLRDAGASGAKSSPSQLEVTHGTASQTGIVLNVISCFLLSGYTVGAFQAVYGEPPFALPAWANSTY